MPHNVCGDRCVSESNCVRESGLQNMLGFKLHMRKYTSKIQVPP